MLVAIFFLIAAAIFAGFASGFFGIGGGMVLVPSLLFILPKWGASSSDMHGAVATSLALLIPTAIVATRKQNKLGHFDVNIFKHWGIGIILGAVIGAIIADSISSLALLVCFSAFLCVALVMQVLKRFFSNVETNTPKRSWMIFSATIIGAVSAILGIGGGLFTSVALRLLHYPLRRSIAFATASAFLIGVVGASANIYTGLGEPGRAMHSLGYVNVPAFLISAPFMMLMAPIGVSAANKIDNRVLKILYGIFFAIVTFLVVSKTIEKL